MNDQRHSADPNPVNEFHPVTLTIPFACPPRYSQASPARGSGGLSTSGGGGGGGGGTIYGTPPGRSFPLSPHTTGSTRQQQQQTTPLGGGGEGGPFSRSYEGQQISYSSRGRSFDSAAGTSSPLRYFG